MFSNIKKKKKIKKNEKKEVIKWGHVSYDSINHNSCIFLFIIYTANKIKQ